MAYCKILLPDGVTELANIKSVTFREAVNSGVDLRPGCVGSASIEVEVFNTQPNAVSAGDALTYYQIDKNNTQTLIGVFYAEPVIATKNSYKFVAYDAASKMNADFSAWLMANQANFPMTIYALVSAACTVAGVTLGSSSWTLSTQNVQAFYADGLTCRDILSYAAELGCKFVRCHSDGNVYFDWYATASNKRICPSSGSSGAETRYAYKQDGLQYTNYTTAAIDGVAVHPSGEDDVAYIYPTSASGNLLNITNNLLLTGADASLYNAAAQAIYTALNTLGTYRPATANLFPRENPFRAGDVVAVTDAQAVSFTTVIMEQTVNESDAVLSSTGNEYYSDADGNTQKALTQLASDVVRINKLKVDWADINVAIVNYLTANNVTAQNLTIVDENDNVLATFDSNGIVLGQNDDVHAELDFNSFSLVDKDGNTYLSIGDMRDANGEASITLSYKANGTSYNLIPSTTSAYFSTVEVTVNGTTVTNYTVSTSQIVFSTAPTAGSKIVIKYKTPNALYHYDFGSRSTGYGMGAYSLAVGRYVAAQGAYSSVSGGNSNVATGNYSAISGGNGNKATGQEASVCGGTENEANGLSSFVGGGIRNKANGPQSSIPGGRQCIADGQNQLVFGAYNVSDTSKVEIVGNGTADNARSNARTLDWSGNETLAGGLTLGVPLAITDGGTGASSASAALANLGAVAKTGDTMSGGLKIEKSGYSYCNVKSDDSQCALDMASASGGAHGLFSSGYYDGSYHADSKWLICRDTSGRAIVNGTATNDFPLGEVISVIPNNSDINDYYLPGAYKIANNTSAATMTNLPNPNAGVLRVHSGLGAAISASSTYKYIVQEYQPYTGLLYTRVGNSGSGTSVTWGNWYRYITTSSLPLAVVNGGTGASSAASALTNLGAAPAPTIVDKSTTSTSNSYITAEYTVSGSGTIIAYAGIYSDDTSSYGTWQAEIYYDGTLIMGEGSRFTTATAQKYGASTSVPIAVTNGKKIKITFLCTKGGTKSLFRRFLCFGCTVS